LESRLNVEIVRDVRITTFPFLDYFRGFDKVEAVRRIFGANTDEVLHRLRVEFAGMRGYMGVSNEDGHLLVSTLYLRDGDIIDIYLDIIHELVHVRQKLLEGKELFDDRFSYVERPTELEAYRFAVEEAKRLGLSDERILRYLKTEWMSNSELKRLAKAMNVNCAEPKRKRTVKAKR
jgi:hypothetical protein